MKLIWYLISFDLPSCSTSSDSPSLQYFSFLWKWCSCEYLWGAVMYLNLLPWFLTNSVRDTSSKCWAAFFPDLWTLGRSIDDSCKNMMHSSILYSSLICVIESPETMINSSTWVCSQVVYLAVVNFDLWSHFKESFWHKLFL